MGLLEILFGRSSRVPRVETGSGSIPKAIKTEADVRAFFGATLGDESLAQVLTEVICRIGRDGFVAVEQGGEGDPYSVECVPWSDDGRSSTAVQAEVADLKRRIASVADSSARDQLERRLGTIAGEVCTLFIRNPSSIDFQKQRDKIRKAMREFKDIANNRP